MRFSHRERMGAVSKKVIERNYRARLVDSQFEGETALAETIERRHSEFIVRIIGRLLILESRPVLYTELHSRPVHSYDIYMLNIWSATFAHSRCIVTRNSCRPFAIVSRAQSLRRMESRCSAGWGPATGSLPLSDAIRVSPAASVSMHARIERGNAGSKTRNSTTRSTRIELP